MESVHVCVSMMTDPDTMRMINMTNFEEAVNLKNVTNDRSNISSMKDSYPLILFSWETFVKLLQKNGIDVAFDVLPFVILIQAIRSMDLNREDRLKLLESAVKVFLFYLNNVRNSSKK